METHRQEFDGLSGALSDFIKERRKHKKQNWFGFPELMKRYFREDKEYPRLLNTDVNFYNGMQRSLRQIVESRNISAGHLEDFSVALAAHKSALSERRKILAFISPMLVAGMAVVTSALKSTEIPCIVSIESIALVSAAMVALAVAERAQNQSWALIYDEFQLLVKQEIERKRGNET